MRSAVVAALVAGALLLLASVALGHDLFLKLDTYFPEPHARVRIPVLNATLFKSEGFVTPERVADMSVVAPVGRTRLAAATAGSRGPDSTSLLGPELGHPGTHEPGGSTRRVRCLVEGRPVANQMVLWGGEQGGQMRVQRRTRTDSDGVAEVTLDGAGRWYVKFVHMVRGTQRKLDYESKWATLTFEVRSVRRRG